MQSEDLLKCKTWTKQCQVMQSEEEGRQEKPNCVPRGGSVAKTGGTYPLQQCVRMLL